MRIALDEARRGEAAGEVPVGAVLVLDEQQVAVAHNEPLALCDPTAHAEVLALRRAAAIRRAYRLPGSVLYATVEPCAMCMGAALHARVARVVFGASDPKGGAAGSVVDLSDVRALNHRIAVEGGVLAAESAEMLQRFFAARRARATRRTAQPDAAPGARAVATRQDEG
jgi:tRNA(adenine34) deaminase